MEWTRDSMIPYPNVWLKFQSMDADNNPVNYYIQDLPENRFSDAIQFMENYFLPEETMMHSKGIKDDPKSLNVLKKIWLGLLRKRLALVCFIEGSDEIVAVNILGITNSNQKISITNELPLPCKELIAAAVYIHQQFNNLAYYGTGIYISAVGLAINPKYRKRGVATEMLKAREPLGKAVGISLTSTLFTSIAAQKAAINAGYEVNFEISFEQLAQAGHVFPNVEGNKTVKRMSKVLNS